MHYYIDGYNFLFRVSKKKLPLEKKRDLILITLNEELEKLRLNTTVVFDSSDGLRDHASRGHLAALEIVYTTKNESADEYIFKAIENAPSPQNETVVTSDRALASKCKYLGAKILSIDQFLTFIKKKKAQKKSLSPIKAFRDSEKEIARLLKIFEQSDY